MLLIVFAVTATIVFLNMLIALMKESMNVAMARHGKGWRQHQVRTRTRV